MGLTAFPDMRLSEEQQREATETLKVCMLGNSFLYFNDAPRLVRKMLFRAAKDKRSTVESCLHPGKSLPELWVLGNGVHNVFCTANARNPDATFDVGAKSPAEALRREWWDCVVLQDHSRGFEAREATAKLLVDEVAPLLNKATPVLVETWSYAHNHLSAEDFESHVAAGIDAYRNALMSAGCQPRVARVGSAFAHIRASKPHVWRRLFGADGVHPSPLGTYLLAALVVAAVIGRPPPPPPLSLTAVKALWADARFMMPDDYIPWPTPGDLSFVHGVVLAYA